MTTGSMGIVEHLSVIDADTGGQAYLADFAGNSQAAWSPDGQQLAMVGSSPDQPEQFTLQLISADGTQVHRVRRPGWIDPMLRVSQWHPSGEFVYLATSSLSPHDRGTALRWSIATDEIVELPTRPVSAVSPDGSRYLTIVWLEGGRGLYEWTAYSSNGRVVYANGIGSGAAWLPDGRLVGSRCEWQATDTFASELVIITPAGQQTTFARYPDVCVGVAPSGDGSLIGIARGAVTDILDAQGALRATIRGSIAYSLDQPNLSSWLPAPRQ